MFSAKDLDLVDSDLKFSDKKSRIEVINSRFGKELFARIFFEKVTKKEIKKTDLEKETIKNFELAFSFIENNLQ